MRRTHRQWALVVTAMTAGIAGWSAAAQEPPTGSTPATAPPVAAPAAPAPAAPAAEPAQSLPTPEEVLAKYIEATGGRAAYERVTSTRLTASVVISPPASAAPGPDGQAPAPLNGRLVEEHQSPNLRRLTLEIDGMGRQDQATDGVDVWVTGPMSGNVLLQPGPDREEFLITSRWHADLDPAAVWESMRTLGIEKVGDIEVVRVELRSKGGLTEVRTYDRATGLLRETASTAVVREEPLTTVTRVEDYRAVDGVKYPFRRLVSQVGASFAITVSEIVHNPTIEPVSFTMPEPIAAIKRTMQDETAIRFREVDVPAGALPPEPKVITTPKPPGGQP